jgi:hypothetical protein
MLYMYTYINTSPEAYVIEEPSQRRKYRIQKVPDETKPRQEAM